MKSPGTAPTPPSGVVYTGPPLAVSLAKVARVLLTA